MNIEKYIGIPYVGHGRDFKGVDCYGLVYLFYKNELGIAMPTYTAEYKDESKAEDAIKKNGLENDRWVKVGAPLPLCTIVLNILGEPRHLGIVLDDRRMLHSLKGHNSAIESYRNTKWKNRIQGFYIYV